MKKHKEEELKQKCGCEEECACEEECKCSEDCSCGEDCKCTEDNKCNENCSCGNHEHEDGSRGEDCACHEKDGAIEAKAEEYLNMARVIQADFDNYRKKSYEQILNAKLEGIAEAVSVMLPALDSFKEAKKMITDEKVLEGVEMIENKMLQSLEVLGIEKIEAKGKPFDHNLHSAIATLRDDSLEDGIIIEEYQAGYKFKDKVLRYSQVVVNKRED